MRGVILSDLGFDVLGCLRHKLKQCDVKRVIKSENLKIVMFLIVFLVYGVLLEVR